LAFLYIDMRVHFLHMTHIMERTFAQRL